MKPYSEACEQNKDPILAVLRKVFATRNKILEIGSGTGQHAVYFGQQLPHLIWQTSDLPENHDGIRQWLDEAGVNNVLPPLALDVTSDYWPIDSVDGVFSANTIHIMSWVHVVKMFEGIGRMLEKGGILCLYGPFNYGGNYTSESNARFDAWLKMRDPLSGVRNFEDVDALAHARGLRLVQDYAMPANNRTLVWEKISVG
jgi:SAM-dependent methyltransferase